MPESMVAVLSVWPIRHLRLHGVIGGYRKLEELKGGYRGVHGSQEVTEGCRRLLDVTLGYRMSPEVAKEI